MLNEKILIWKVKHGCTDSLRRIYDAHKDDLLTLANALLNDRNAAEDIVHDVFVSFANSVGTLHIRKSLAAYLRSSVRNQARDRFRSQKRHSEKLLQIRPDEADGNTPDELACQKESELLLRNAIAQLPYEQREVVVLHLRGGLTFGRIAAMQEVSINTVQGRYRYGLDKLRSMLNEQVSE